jgi:hypothetical protein
MLDLLLKLHSQILLLKVCLMKICLIFVGTETVFKRQDN